jgi:ATP-dependent Lon protease
MTDFNNNNSNNKKSSNNKRRFQDLEILNNTDTTDKLNKTELTKLSNMPKPKRKKSETEDSLTGPPPNGDANSNIMDEINKLKKIIEQQKKKINSLEKKTKDFSKKGFMLEDAVNDLYDIIEEWNEHGDSDDPDYDPTAEIKEFFKGLPPTMKMDNEGNIIIDETMIEKFTKDIEELKNGSDKGGDSNSGNSNTIKSNMDTSSDELSTVMENNIENKTHNTRSKKNKKNKSQKNTSNKLKNTSSTTTLPEDELEIELTSQDLKNIYGSNGEEYLQQLIKDALKKSKPEEYIEEYCSKNNLDSKVSKELLQQYKHFKELNKIINNNTDKKTSDIDIFIQNHPEKRKVILQSMENLSEKLKNVEGYKFKILSSGMDTFVQQQALYKVKQLENTEIGTGEYYKLKNWLDTLTAVPFNNYKDIDLGSNSISKFLENSRGKMDKVIYGQNDTKDIIIQIIAKMISNPGKCGNVFAIYGPPGVGKTTIIKEGMSKALGLPFAFLSLGGASDSSFLEGHGYTYEGSTPGKIVDIIRKVECMNPIFYFDELDKISETRKGEEIANLLIHLTDPSQNNHFQDKYLGDINLDLSKSIFVFSFNNIEKVNPILLDRMELIYVDGFTNDEKKIISRDYLIPELLDTYNLYSPRKGRPSKKRSDPAKVPDIDFTEDNLDYIIKFNKVNQLDCPPEDGVRGIKRRLEKICSNLNIVKLTKGKWSNNVHSVLDKCEELKNCKFPITLSNDTITKLLLSSNALKNRDSRPMGMYL